jgi:hypothetical protein
MRDAEKKCMPKTKNTVKPVLRGHLWDKEKVVF